MKIHCVHKYTAVPISYTKSLCLFIQRSEYLFYLQKLVSIVRLLRSNQFDMVSNIPNPKKIVHILDNVPNLSHFPLNFNPYIFDSLSISICDQYHDIKKVTRQVKRNVKISPEKKANKSNTKQKNIIFDRVLLCFRRGNCYVMSMSKVHTSLLLCWCSCV